MKPTPTSPETSITDHLLRWDRDPKTELDAVYPDLAAELRRLAASFLASESPEHTLQATALVHELYLKLVQRRTASWKDRSHFIGFAARTMRRILVDHARARATEKRGGDWVRLPWNESLDDEPADEGGLHLPALDEALQELEQLDPRLHRIVELRFFAGLSVAEVAEVLGVGTATVQRSWATARAWLHGRLSA